MSRRVTTAEFRRINLRCHRVLGDVPLHDVWAIPLEGGGPGRTIRDAHAILFGSKRSPSTLPVRALFRLRWTLGRVFGWDDERHDPLASSYIHRLEEADRQWSEVLPGTREGPFRVLYVFANEALSELRNATVHGFMALALIPRAEDYTLYMAVYVRPMSRLTPFYMALIDPFRRFIVYPAFCRSAQRSWAHAYAPARALSARRDAASRRRRRVAYAAALWAAVFAVFHITWAAGWYPLLDGEQARIAFATPWKWAFDVVVAVMCLIAVPVALAPVMSWGGHLPRRLIYTLACVGSTLLVLRAAASLIQVGYLAASGRFRISDLGIWEPWFYLGAVLFSLSTWQSSPTRV